MNWIEAAVGEQSGHGRPLWNSKNWSLGYCDELNEAAITEDRMKKSQSMDGRSDVC
jgi:hypothetical protein